MGQYVYWHAALWEVLLVAAMGLACLAWLAWRALRRPHLREALAAIDPALNEQALFLFDRVRGITCLNDGAERLLKGLPSSRRAALLDALADTLLEAHEEGRATQQRSWPEPGFTLVAIPVAGRSEHGAAAMGLVTAEGPLPAADRAGAPQVATEREDWLELGPTLRVHRTRPLVYVRRSHPGGPAASAWTWQVQQLSPMEDVLLRYLLEHRSQVQAAEALFHIVWPDDELPAHGLRPDQRDRLRRLVHQLRQHVEADPADPRCVCTAHGVGYVLYGDGE